MATTVNPDGSVTTTFGDDEAADEVGAAATTAAPKKASTESQRGKPRAESKVVPKKD